MKTKEKIRQIIGIIVLIVGILGLFLPIIPGIVLVLLSFRLLENSKNINKIANRVNKLITKSKKSINILRYKKA